MESFPACNGATPPRVPSAIVSWDQPRRRPLRLRTATAPARISSSSTSRVRPFRPWKVKEQNECRPWSAPARCDVALDNPEKPSWFHRQGAREESQRLRVWGTSPIRGHLCLCSDKRRSLETARTPSGKLRRRKSCASLRQRNSELPWESCYL